MPFAFFKKRRLERHNPGFDPALLLAARLRTRAALSKIAAQIRPGMREADAAALAAHELEQAGAEKHWHRIYVRFGENTLLPYGVKSAPDVFLRETDIFFIDIGPVFDGYEGDLGDTFTAGADAEMLRCKRDVRRIFHDTRKHWLVGGVSGADLYQTALVHARERGWILNLNVDGHRLSQFPHHAHFRGGLAEADFQPIAGAWVLEIQIRHPERKFGAFYEDLLVRER
jgi:Xaa-Pro aminopeptidase